MSQGVADREAQGQLALEHEAVVQRVVGLEVRPDNRYDAAAASEQQGCARALPASRPPRSRRPPLVPRSPRQRRLARLARLEDLRSEARREHPPLVDAVRWRRRSPRRRARP